MSKREYKFKACPFCGCVNVTIYGDPYYGDHYDPHYAVSCDNEECASEGPTCHTETEAVEKWNIRVGEE